ncbi:MAG: outer membrane beta-barrel protein [Cyanobacteria bacterium P01_D01_bin.71]
MKRSQIALWGLTAVAVGSGIQPALALPEKSLPLDKPESTWPSWELRENSGERSPRTSLQHPAAVVPTAPLGATRRVAEALKQPSLIEQSPAATAVETDWAWVEAAIAPVTEASELSVVEIVEPGTGQAWLPADSASTLLDGSPTLAQATPGQQSDSGWYVALTPSLVFGYDINIDGEDITVPVIPAPGLPPIGTTDVPVDASIDTDTGFGISGAFGYRFDDARVELEIGYLNNSVDSITVNDVETSTDGSIDNWQFLVNGYYDIPTNSRFRPYIGGGIGLAIVSADDISATVPSLGELSIDDSSSSFVFQIKGGVGYDITDDLNAFLGYRLLGIPGQSFEVFDTDLDADTVFIHSLQLGARYEF